jgi:hypothetical protein
LERRDDQAARGQINRRSIVGPAAKVALAIGRADHGDGGAVIFSTKTLSKERGHGFTREKVNVPRSFHRRLLPVKTCLLFLFTLSSLTSLHTAEPPRATAIPRQTRDISGWQVHIQTELLEAEPATTEHALMLLKKMLAEITLVVPADAVTALRQVPLYFSPAYKSGRSSAEFHPDAGWLRDNGRDPAMAHAVEFSGVADFEAEMNRMPNFLLHELAHAYHHRVLKDGFANAEIKSAYDRVKTAGTYERVERWNGNGRPNTRERAYAMTDPMEYFAETTEAYFVRNDFFPFTRDELRKHDPEMLTLLEKLWGVAPAEKTSPAK